MLRLLPVACCFLLNPLLGSTLRQLNVMESIDNNCVLVYEEGAKGSPSYLEDPSYFQGGTSCGKTALEAVQKLLPKVPAPVGCLALKQLLKNRCATVKALLGPLPNCLKQLIDNYAGNVSAFDLVKALLGK